MTAVTFDTLKLAQRLRDEVKFSPEQAEQAAVVLTETFSDWVTAKELATKQDILAVKQDIKDLRTDMREMNLQITIRLGGMIIGLGGILIAIKYFG